MDMTSITGRTSVQGNVKFREILKIGLVLIFLNVDIYLEAPVDVL